MANESPAISGLDILGTILGGILTKDPFAYPKFKMGMQKLQLENLYRQKELERADRPISDLLSKEAITKPPAAGIEQTGPTLSGLVGEGGTGFGFEPPTAPVRTSLENIPKLGGIDVASSRIGDIPTLANLATLMKKQEPGVGGTSWGTYSKETGQPIFQRTVEPKLKYARNKAGDLVTYTEGDLPPAGFQPIEHEPREAAAKLPLHRDVADQKTGITWRQEYGDDGVTKIGKPYAVHVPAPEKKGELDKGKAYARISTIEQARANLISKGVTTGVLDAITNPEMKAFMQGQMGNKLSPEQLAPVMKAFDTEIAALKKAYELEEPTAPAKGPSLSSKKVQEQVDKFSGLPVPGVSAESMKTQKASIFKRKDGRIYARMPDGTEIEGELKEGKFIPKR